jgi:hypothetical protein
MQGAYPTEGVDVGVLVLANEMVLVVLTICTNVILVPQLELLDRDNNDVKPTFLVDTLLNAESRSVK